MSTSNPSSLELQTIFNIKQGNSSVYTDSVKISMEIVEHLVKCLTIAGQTADQIISLDLSRPTFLYVESEKPISLKVNGAAVPTPEGKTFLYTGTITSTITSLSISNPNTENAKVKIVVGGS
jgi:hypothetical protein